MNEEFDVVVVGGGPSGSSAAVFASKQGLNVLLLDKEVFPREKTCGDGISGKSIKMLRELDIENKIESVQHSLIKGIIFSSANGNEFKIDLPQKGKKKTYGYCCKRFLFDNLMFQNAKKYAKKTVEGFTVIDVIKENDFVVGVRGVDKKGVEKEFRAKIVVGADGANSVIAQKLDLEQKEDKHLMLGVRKYMRNVGDAKNKIELHFTESLIPGYFWIFPVGNNESNVGIAVVASAMKKNKLNLQKEFDKILNENPKFKERFKSAKDVSELKGWQLPLGSKRRTNHGNGFLLVGDAGSLIDPFTGEGIGNATTSGNLVANTLKKAVDTKDYSKEMLSNYEKDLSALLDEELKNNFRLQKLLNYKFIMNKLIKKANSDFQIGEMVTGTFTEEKPLKAYSKIGVLLKILF